MNEMEKAKADRFVALLRLTEGLSPVEIEHHLKEKGEDPQRAHDISLAAEVETGHPKRKMERKKRREWKRYFEELASREPK